MSAPESSRGASATAPTRERVDWIDAGRGIAISLVVLYHTAQWLTAPGFDTETWQRVNDALATLRMPLFFTIAGLYAGKWVAGSWLGLWQAKISLFSWVYGVWCVLATLPFMLGLSMQGQGGNYLALYRFLLTDPFRPRFELWFIWALSLFFVGLKLARSVGRGPLLAGSALVSAIAFAVVDLGNPGWDGLLRYPFFFMLGMFCREAILRFGRLRDVRVLTAVCVSWVVLATLGALTDANGWVGYYFVTAVLGVGTGITASRGLQRVAWLRHVGQQTLPVYLSHTSLILVIVWFVHYLPEETRSASTAAVLVPLVASLALLLSRAIFLAIGRRPGTRLLYEQPTWWRDLPAPGARARG